MTDKGRRLIFLYTIKHLDEQHIGELSRLIAKYSSSVAEAKAVPAEFYLYHPATEHGKNVFCAFDDEDNLRAFAPLVAVPATDAADPDAPNHIWTVITVDPDLEDKQVVREELFQKICERAHEISRALGNRKTRLASDLFDNLREEIEYFLSEGFDHYESVYIMARDCTKPIPDLPSGPEMTIRRWKVETPEEQRQYIDAHDLVFNTSPMTLEGFQCFLNSEEWAVGTIVGAFAPDGQFIGGVTAFWNEAENKRTGKRIGKTEDVFVIPEWRGRGVARQLVAEALRYLKESGLEEARLEVRTTNHSALKLYISMGYEIVREELLLGMYV